jgi:plasmid stability protein
MPANLHVRNVDDDIIAAIKKRAAENGRSAEAEHRAALEKVFGGMGREEWDRRAEALSRSILARRGGTPLPSSVDLIREDRDKR